MVNFANTVSMTSPNYFFFVLGDDLGLERRANWHKILSFRMVSSAFSQFSCFTQWQLLFPHGFAGKTKTLIPP
jgi:hypothetical protein